MLIYILIAIAVFAVILLIFLNTVFAIIDNTKKYVMFTTITVMKCYQNNTGCSFIMVEVNRTDIGNESNITER